MFEESVGVYGVRKVWRQMLRDGIRVARCTAARPMRQMGLKGVVRNKAVRITISDKRHLVRSTGSTASSGHRRRIPDVFGSADARLQSDQVPPGLGSNQRPVGPEPTALPLSYLMAGQPSSLMGVPVNLLRRLDPAASSVPAH